MVGSRKHHHVLDMLAAAGERGRADDTFLSRFTPELLDLVNEDLATVEREVKTVRGWPVEVARLRITDEGRKAIEKRQPQPLGTRTSKIRRFIDPQGDVSVCAPCRCWECR